MERVWLKNYARGVPKTIDVDVYENLNELFDKYISEFSSHRAFTNFNATITYQQLDELSRSFATYLQQKLRLEKGDRVAVILPNLLQYPVVVFGILRAGLIVVNVNPLYTPRELRYQLNDSEANTIIVLTNFAHTVASVLSDTNVKNVIVTKAGDLMGRLKGAIVNFMVKYIKRKVPIWSIADAIPFKEVIAVGQNLSFNPVTVKGDDIAFLQYTGGTTGVAKGAVLTHRNMVANVLQSVACVQPVIAPGKEVVIGALPFYHIFALTGCCLCFMALGAECILITNPRDLNNFIKLLSKTPTTIFIGICTLFNALLHHPNFNRVDFSKLKLTIGGGMATQKTVAEKWKKQTGVQIIEGYGLTEASPVVSLNPVNLQEFNGSAGLPVPDTDVVVRDENNNELPFGNEGELWVKGPQVMKEYWKQPEETKNTIDAEGWLRTGDIVKMDDHGFIYIVDRKKDMIVVSGFNVYPSEIEEVIMSHNGVKEVAVVGVPSTKTGEMIKAFIVKKDSALTENELITYCRDNLTAYKIPKEIEFRDDLPKSHIGKIPRRHLRDGERKKQQTW